MGTYVTYLVDIIWGLSFKTPVPPQAARSPTTECSGFNLPS